MTLAQAGAQTPALGTDGENVFWHISWTWFGCERKGSRTGWEEEIAEQKKWDFSVQKSNIRWELPPGDLRNRGRGPESRREELRDRWVVCGHDRSEGESDTGQTGATEPACLWWGREGPWRLARSKLHLEAWAQGMASWQFPCGTKFIQKGRGLWGWEVSETSTMIKDLFSALPMWNMAEHYEILEPAKHRGCGWQWRGIAV